jgi:hypothetical protein
VGGPADAHLDAEHRRGCEFRKDGDAALQDLLGDHRIRRQAGIARLGHSAEHDPPAMGHHPDAVILRAALVDEFGQPRRVDDDVLPAHRSQLRVVGQRGRRQPRAVRHDVSVHVGEIGDGGLLDSPA